MKDQINTVGLGAFWCNGCFTGLGRYSIKQKKLNQLNTHTHTHTHTHIYIYMCVCVCVCVCVCAPSHSSVSVSRDSSFFLLTLPLSWLCHRTARSICLSAHDIFFDQDSK